MKKIILLVFCLMVIPMTLAFAEPSSSDLKTAPSISKLEIHDDGGNNVWLEVTVQTPANVRSAVDYFENHELGYNQAGYIGGIEIQYSIDGNEWQVCGLGYSPNYEQDEDNWSGIFETEYLNELHVDSEVKAQARYTGADANGDLRYSDWSNVLTLNEKVDFAASTWAKGELADADKMGLIPDRLKGEDLTKPITREEFAAVAVKVYEALTGNTATPAANNPFTDTSDTEVLKAYDLGITSGTSATTFSPTVVLNREQAATMLTNTYKKATMPGWTAATNGDYTLNYEKKNTFADDDKISAWAKDSVYFMNANNIISGVGDNKFAPKNTTSAEEAMGYANATREQALVIASKMVKNLK
jgi:hypothetical protein